MNHDAITVTEIDSKDFHFVKLDEVNQNKFSLDENEDEKQVNVRVDAETCAILGLDFETSDYCEHVPYFESLFHKELPFNTLTTKLTDIIWTWGGISIYLCFVTKR